MFYTKTEGVGGRIKQRIEDFVVEEIPPRKSAEKNNKPESDEYIIFWLEKFNWDTNQILKLIAKKLHVAADRFRIAGTKDKRALTRQRVSLWDSDKKLEERLREVRIRDIKIYNISRGDKLRLGGLEGNRFVITIRDIGMQEDEIKNRLEALFAEIKKGIPNIFGPQRFGETRPITAVVGKEMLKNNFENAVKTYLADYFEAEPDDAKKARRFLSENWNPAGFKKSLEMFPYRLKNERSMLGYLCEHPNDFAGALRRLPKRLRKMFLNAYQAEMWNRAAEEYYAGAKNKNEIGNMEIPLAGYDTEFDDENPIHKKLTAMLKRDKIGLADFALRGMPELKCFGGERNFLLFPKALKLLGITDDEFNAGKKAVKISFNLPKGSYATIVLREIMKNAESA
ncbi:MAG: tRNA pseudouridine(13) synthase TruD [Nanoarchaeota archaeon]|nr:tRNA pseudouridine(13) synthase TruD [Nanoarchaeota archaeon]